jgi:hypothetical protein
MELDWSLGLINASPTHADFQICGCPGSKNAKCESPSFWGARQSLVDVSHKKRTAPGPATIKPASLLCGGTVGAKKMIRAAHAKEKQ